jgi:CRISPR-associated protein Cmr2
MASKQTFHFSIGPVQGYVSQARRTRDLWAGSYLLSYLSGIALLRIKNDGGEIIIPAVNRDNLYLSLEGTSRTVNRDDLPARVGSLPNRFIAKADDPQKVTEAAVKAVNSTWNEIAGEVWNWFEDKTNSILKDETKTIWDRQVANQWEISWVVGEEVFLLDQRKNLRSHFVPKEPGEKCTLCGERQALSKKLGDGRQTVRNW